MVALAVLLPVMLAVREQRCSLLKNVLLTGASVLAACTCTGRTLGASAIVIAHQNPDESIGRGVSIELCPLETIHRAGSRVAGRPGAGAGVAGGARTMEKLAGLHRQREEAGEPCDHDGGGGVKCTKKARKNFHIRSYNSTLPYLTYHI